MRMALDKLPLGVVSLSLSISVTNWLTDFPSFLDMTFNLIQNASSKDMLVGCPAIMTERFKIALGALKLLSTAIFIFFTLLHQLGHIYLSMVRAATHMTFKRQATANR
jgi:hypothetical protein